MSIPIKSNAEVLAEREAAKAKAEGRTPTNTVMAPPIKSNAEILAERQAAAEAKKAAENAANAAENANTAPPMPLVRENPLDFELPKPTQDKNPVEKQLDRIEKKLDQLLSK